MRWPEPTLRLKMKLMALWAIFHIFNTIKCYSQASPARTEEPCVFPLEGIEAVQLLFIGALTIVSRLVRLPTVLIKSLARAGRVTDDVFSTDVNSSRIRH